VSKKKQKKHFDRLDWDIDLNRLFENPLRTLLSTMSHCNSIFEAEINSSCIICHKTFSRKDFRNPDSRRTITSNSVAKEIFNLCLKTHNEDTINIFLEESPKEILRRQYHFRCLQRERRRRGETPPSQNVERQSFQVQLFELNSFN